MSANTKKNILVLVGPGFYEQPDLIENLQAHGHRVVVRSLSFDGKASLIDEFAICDVIVLRGPWSGCAEEKLYARLLGLRLLPGLEHLNKRFVGPNPPHLFAMGRAALAYFLTVLSLEKQFNDSLKWESCFKNSGPWVEYEMEKYRAFALLQGRVFPQIKDPSKFNLKELIVIEGHTIAWRHGKYVTLSFADLFSCAERNQLLNFGYEDLLNVQTQVDLFEALIR
jgi:hypothetical protein